VLLHGKNAFIVRDTQEWFYLADVHANARVILEATSSAIHPNQPNEIRVLFETQQTYNYTFVVNGVGVGTGRTGNPHGSVGLAVENPNLGKCVFEFDDFELRRPSR
jgi:hypothetical protein